MPTSRVNGAAMVDFFLYIIMTGMFLAAAGAQETTPAATTPSVADAARAARERRESMTPVRIMTDDDIAAKRGAGDLANRSASEQEVRAEMEKHYPSSLTKADLTQQIGQIKSIAARGDADMLVAVKNSALAGYENVDFPGKKHWEEDVSVAATRMVEEADKGAARLQAIVDDNQNVLAGRDLAASAHLREMWIDALSAAGVRRISFGGALYRCAMSAVVDTARALRTGDVRVAAHGIPAGEIVPLLSGD